MAISFSGADKLITLSSGTTSLSVKDLWSRWVDWLSVGDNSKYQAAFDTVGGNEIDASSGTSIPIYLFMKNGWKIRPQEASHTLNVYDGILLVDGGGDPFVDPLGDYTVRINYQQPVQAITAGGGDPWGTTVEGTLTAGDALRVLLAVMAGKSSGGGGSTISFRDTADSKDRIVATVDGNGNRTSVTLDAG